MTDSAEQHCFANALACVLRARALFEQVHSPGDVEDEVQWMAGLRERLGENQFTALVAQVELQTEQIRETMLRQE